MVTTELLLHIQFMGWTDYGQVKTNTHVKYENAEHQPRKLISIIEDTKDNSPEQETINCSTIN
jgi:hypothetical protein